ncbi:MAG: GyrI-like domain-containing protein [Bacteroidota bacterium]|nr:GyrI-like domain-containing protein [Bacteroidota bacterium]
MQQRIEILRKKKLVGKCIRMSFSVNRTIELWQSFMPELKKIKNNIGHELYSVEIYSSKFFENFNSDAEFDKWAAIEVNDFNIVPDDMQTIIIPDGLYVVFLHKGPASEGEKSYQYIFGSWLPDSEYLLDNRPHFAVMGEKYKNDDPDSEEELWIPVKKK